MNTQTIINDLAAVAYSEGDYTVECRFRVHDEEFEEFAKFPLVVVESGDEEDNPNANGSSDIVFMPTVHLYTENGTLSEMEAWRDAIRNAIMSDSALIRDSDYLAVTGIMIAESDARKLQHMIFSLEIRFEIYHV